MTLLLRSWALMTLTSFAVGTKRLSQVMRESGPLWSLTLENQGAAMSSYFQVRSSMRIVRSRFGTRIVFPLGFSIGFSWIHGNGESSYTSASIFSWHHPKSITWRLSICWNKPSLKYILIPNIHWRRTPNKYNYYHLKLPLIGGLTLNTQPHMFRSSDE